MLQNKFYSYAETTSRLIIKLSQKSEARNEGPRVICQSIELCDPHRTILLPLLRQEVKRLRYSLHSAWIESPDRPVLSRKDPINHVWYEKGEPRPDAAAFKSCISRSANQREHCRLYSKSINQYQPSMTGETVPCSASLHLPQ